MNGLDPRRTVGELVTEHPARSRVFEEFRIDYCCGGRKPLGAACLEAGVETERVLDALKAVEDAPVDGCRRWSEASSPELVEHILSVHHEFLRRELPRLDALIEKVVRVHGGNHRGLPSVRATFLALREELELHIAKEENVLFPAIVASCKGSSRVVLDGPIGVMMHEHDSAGRALEQLRSRTGNFVPPEDACNTYRAMLDGLAEFERDLHQHIHEENNILFPRFADRSIAAANAG